MRKLYPRNARTVAGLILSIFVACSNGRIDQHAVPDGGFSGDDLAVATVDGSPCDPGTSSCGSICCLAGEICYGEQCLVPGDACQLHSDCPYGHFCDPLLQVCLPQEAAFCQYRPPVGELSPKVEWTWTGSKTALPNHFDVLAPPVVVHLTDDNQDGKLGPGDVPDVVVVTYADVSGHPVPIYHDGVLRAISGDTGQELWSVTAADQRLIAGASVAAADINNDGKPEIVAVDADFKVKAFSGQGTLLWTSKETVASREASEKKYNGWGGGIAVADLDADGQPEIFFDATVFDNTGKLKWKKVDGGCAATKCSLGPLSTAANLDGDAAGTLELVVGHRVYSHTGQLLWQQDQATDGYPAVADFFSDSDPDVVLVASGKVYILDGKSGALEWGPVDLPYPADGEAAKAGPGGPPTVADFDGDGRPEIGVAGGYYYVVFDPDCQSGSTDKLCASGNTAGILWKKASKDLSSRATGSSVFDFEGDGKAEVIYSDECFLRVHDGTTGKVLFKWSNNTRTATEAPIVADVDSDGRAEILMVSNRRVWACDTTYSGWQAPPGYKEKGDPGYHGLTVLGDAEDNWVGTRRIWNQHSYHVSNICDGIDQACSSQQNEYSRVHQPERANWTIPWLNNFRQNVQGLGLFNAPDLVAKQVTINGVCSKELTSVSFTVTNQGSAVVAAGLKVSLYMGDPLAGGSLLITVSTTKLLGPTESEDFTVELKLPANYNGEPFEIHVVADDTGDGKGERKECNEGNNVAHAAGQCLGPG